MAQKKKRAFKADAGTETKKVAMPSKPKPTISTLDEAVEWVEEGFKKDLVLDYVVLENKQVFYGVHRNLAVRTAEKFGLKYFDVKLK
jgi:hypothetical protein